MIRTTGFRTLATIGVLTMTSTSMGCVIWDDAPFKGDKSAAIAHVAGSSVKVESENGSIKLTKAGTAEVTIHATVRAKTQERLDAVKITANREAGGVLHVFAQWPTKRENSEGVSFEIQVPDANGVTLNTSNGSLIIGALAGQAELTTSNGAITISGHEGSAAIKTSNGQITVSDLTGMLTAKTSNGGISVTLPDANQGPANLTTTNGSIKLSVGKEFKGTVSASTSNGRVTTPEGAAKGNSATWKAGEGSPSTLQSSNGSITIERR